MTDTKRIEAQLLRLGLCGADMASAETALARAAHRPIDKDATMRRLAGEVSQVLAGQDLSTALGAVMTWFAAQVDLAGDPKVGYWAADKLSRLVEVFERGAQDQESRER